MIRDAGLRCVSTAPRFCIEGGNTVEYCMAPAALLPAPLEIVWEQLRRFFAPFMAEVTTRQADRDREKVNRQAERLLTEHGNSILRLAYSYLHNMSDAEEVLQDTLVQFLKTAPVFESRQHEKAWLLRVAGNLSKNRLAYNSVRKTDELNEELAAGDREDLSFVWDAVKLLPENYRAVIHLFYYEGYSTKQIARMLQKKEATVRSDLHRGREKLKAVLKEAYDFEKTV